MYLDLVLDRKQSFWFQISVVYGHCLVALPLAINE